MPDRHFRGTQIYDLKPDILTCAKGLSAAMQPISAVLIIAEAELEEMAEKTRAAMGTVHRGVG